MAEVRDDSVSIDVRDDLISIRVGERLRVLPPASSECNIFKVPDPLRKENKEAYEPQILAIGPYHLGKDRLKAMEEHKIRYLQLLLQRRNEEDKVKGYVVALRALEERARICYAESISINSDDFVEMMLLDGCFLVELIRKQFMENLRGRNDPIFKVSWIRHSLTRDMLLLENQLPFFVLGELFDMTVMPNQQEDFTKKTYNYFYNMLPGPMFKQDDINYSIEEIKHLLDFIHKIWLHSHPIGKSNAGDKWMHIRCATELEESGIQFKKVDPQNLFKIRFENGIMEIPTVAIGKRTETFLRNLLAYEQCSESEIPNYVSSYVIVMDGLVNSAKDVELLRRCGIIINDLGDDEVVANICNRLKNSLVISGDFYYSEIYNKVNEHCSKRWNTWKSILKHKYFNNPWALLSVFAAIVLLLLTLAQTTYSILSYHK